jgi:hypothetical protein
MSKDRKRELTREYKERKVRRGVYAVRCTATNEVWAASSLNLDAQKNSLFFQLRTGGHPNRTLQAAWQTHSDAAFSFEEVAELNGDERSAYALKADLKALEQEWREKLGAKAVTG